jgi:rhodanese-related sulfurtransferase
MQISLKHLVIVVSLFWSMGASSQGAEENRAPPREDGIIPLYQGKPFLHVVHQGRSVKVQRVQDPDYQLHGYFAKTGRRCPPFCLQPMQVDPRVKAIGEIEVFRFMENQLRDGSGLLIDARTPKWHKKGTIPGSINVPFSLLRKEINDPETVGILTMFGAKQRKDTGDFTWKLEKWGVINDPQKTDQWDFSSSKELVLWCNGPACGQSPRAIQGLLDLGYPAEKIRYYRGGMQLWLLFGLNTVKAQE